MRTAQIDQLPSMSLILESDLIGEFRKTIIEVMKCTNGSATDNIMKKLVFTLSVLEDIREEYADVMEKGGER